MRLTGLGLFVLAISHYIVVHFVYDPAHPGCRLGHRPLGRASSGSVTIDWMMLVFVLFHSVHGRAHGHRRLHDRAAARSTLT